MNVHPIGDDLGGHVSPFGTCSYRAGVAVVKARHRVEQVRHVPRSRVESRARGVIAGSRVGNGYPHVVRDFVDKVEVSRLLGGNVDQFHQPLRRLLQPIELLNGRTAHICGVLSSNLLGGDERPFEVDAHQRRFVRRATRLHMACYRAHDGNQALFGKRHRRRADGGYAARSLITCNFRDSLIRGIAKVLPHRTVQMHVDEPRNHIAACGVHIPRRKRSRPGRLNTGKPLALRNHVQLPKALTVEHQTVHDTHNVSSLLFALPPARLFPCR